MIAPGDLREIIRHGLLSFPVTPFDDQDRFNPKPFAARLRGFDAGPVRAPLMDLTDEEMAMMQQLIEGAG